jgi:23S rRNA pseudoU1915 N3-methylase RlmH
MEAIELRRRLVDYINKADETVLKEVQALVENYENDSIVAYTVQGKPLNREEFQKEISEAEAEYKKGNFSTQDQLEEEVRNWRK